MIKKISIGLLALFAAAQFINPDKNESEFVPESDFITLEQPPEHLASILKTSCYDCHSNNTIYPWYDRITPVNFWVNSHITDGKKHLNFSEWNSYSAKKKAHKLDEFIEMIEDKEMPLASYTLTHQDAKLSDADIIELTNWVTLVKIKTEVANQPL
ncbi:MAG: heme-binding domain-containing protein [Flavobacteriaceae bacterium]